MFKTADEILIKYAASFDDFPVPPPEPPKPEDLIVPAPKELPKEESEPHKTNLPIPIPLPKKVLTKEDLEQIDKELEELGVGHTSSPKKEEKKPLSMRDVDDPPMGTAEWAAKHHTQEFLKGVKQPWRGWIRDPANWPLVERTMNQLVEEHPEHYFSWDLHRRQELLPWLYPAGKKLIEVDPMMALMKEIWRFRELRDLQTELWKKVIEKEIQRSSQDPQSSGQLFPGRILNNMRHLAGEIADTDPEFYLDYIAGKPVTTEQFDEKAKRVWKEKLDLGKAEEAKLKYKTKL